MKKNWSILVLTLLLVLSVLVACSGKQKFADLKLVDGVYEGSYTDDNDDRPSTVKVKITIERGKITACESAEYDANNKIKAAEYAAKAPEAALAVTGMVQYPAFLLDKQDPDAIDAVSGATFSLQRFQKAVWNALEKAVEK